MIRSASLALLTLLAVASPGLASELEVVQGAGALTVQTADWKLVFGESFNGGPYQWFDRRFDPAEVDNLAAACGGGTYTQGVPFDYDVYLGTSGVDAIEFMTTMGANPAPGALALSLLEETPARVRIRRSGHPRLNNGGGPPGDPFPELQLIGFSETWTIQRVHTATALEATLP